jgi:hypothetical protein
VDGDSLCTAMDRMNVRRDEESQRIKAHLSDVQTENVFDVLGNQ